MRMILESRVLVYKRINNSGINSLGKERDKILCSVFFDWKKERERDKFKCQQEPIIEHLAKVLKIKPLKTNPHWLSFNSSF